LKIHEPQYQEYVKSNPEAASNLAVLIKNFVEYGKTRTTRDSDRPVDNSLSILVNYDKYESIPFSANSPLHCSKISRALFFSSGHDSRSSQKSLTIQPAK
jgi:hypothetical protein